LLERESIITQNSPEEKRVVEVTWKSKAQVYYAINDNPIRQATVLFAYDQLNQIELHNERKDLMARDLTTLFLTMVWQSFMLECKEPILCSRSEGPIIYR
jgi:hypothetical protein